MPKDTDEVHIHIHLHEGVTPEAAKAVAEALQPKQAEVVPEVEDAPAEVDESTRLEYIRRAYTESEHQAKPLLEFLAEHPDELVDYPTVSAALGFDTPRSLPGLLGSFGRRAKHRYEGVKPFEAIWLDNEWHLRMPADAADIVNSLR